MRQVELDDGYSVQRLVAMSEAAEDVLPQLVDALMVLGQRRSGKPPWPPEGRESDQWEVPDLLGMQQEGLPEMRVSSIEEDGTARRGSCMIRNG